MKPDASEGGAHPPAAGESTEDPDLLVGVLPHRGSPMSDGAGSLAARSYSSLLSLVRNSTNSSGDVSISPARKFVSSDKFNYGASSTARRASKRSQNRAT